MVNLISIIFVVLGTGYLFFLYKKRLYIASMYWLGGFMLTYILPNLVKDNYTFGYSLDSNLFLKLNFCYLIVLILFIVTNHFMITNKMKIKEKNYLGLNYKTLNRVSFIYFILSVILVPIMGISNFFLRTGSIYDLTNSNFGLIIPIVIFGLVLSSIIKLFYVTSVNQKTISLIQLLYSLYWGLNINFARRIVIYPIIIGVCFYFVIRKKKPKILTIVISIIFLLIIVLPLMVSIRTLGLSAGINNYKQVLFGDYADLVGYLQMSLDVTWSYPVAAIAMFNGAHIDPLTLLKPLSVLIPRSIWADKPLPMSLALVRELHISDNQDLSVPPGVIGEAYIYFGIIGIILSGTLWGCFTGILDQRIVLKEDSQNIKNDFSILVSLTLCIQILMGVLRGDTSTTLIETETVIIPFITLLYLSKKIHI